MNDIGSDSDATIADNVDEEDANSDSSGSPEIYSTKVEAENPPCTLSGLQRRQKLLFEKLEKVAAETATVEYVQGLQEDYLTLEESLRQLSKITRQERKQLSDELEIASTTGKSGHSFQQQLLQLSSKQKTLLQCFDNQKRLGSHLKVLLSSQNHYSTRSKALLQQVHTQDNASSSYHRNVKPPSRQGPKVAMDITSHCTPSKPVQPVKSPINLPSSSQLTTAVVGQLSKNVSKANSVALVNQQEISTVITTHQQSHNIAAYQQKDTTEKPQQLVGVAPYKQVVDETTTKQTTGVVIEQSQSVTNKTLPPVPVNPCQQQSINVTTVGVATQQLQQPVGVAVEKQSMNKQQPQSMGVALQQGRTTQHSQLVGVAKQPLFIQQPRGVATKQQQPVSTTPRLLHSELSQPVPLDVLIQHQLISSQDQCLTCTLMGCQFTGSLAADGTIISQEGCKFLNPPQWLNNCWATLGHSKRVDRRTAYSKVYYKEKSLLHHCLIYSQQKVTSYLNRSHDHLPTNKTTPLTDKTDRQPEDIIDMTEKNLICPIFDQELLLSNEWLPAGFWECSNIVLVNSELENDLIYF